jgi:hypothetical protein
LASPTGRLLCISCYNMLIVSGSPTHTHEALNSPDINVVDIEGRPTITIPNGLNIVQAAHHDMACSPTGYSLLEDWMLPVPDLREKILEVPIWPAVNKERIYGRESIRWLGHEITDQLAADEGFPDFSHWMKRNRPYPRPMPTEKVDAYCRIRDGLSLTAEIEGKDGEVPSWQGIIDKYGADDPIVQNFFARVQESVRLDAAKLLNYLASTIRIHTVFSDNPMHEQITHQLDTFLLDKGYIPDRSGVAVIELKKPSQPTAE